VAKRQFKHRDLRIVQSDFCKNLMGVIKIFREGSSDHEFVNTSSPFTPVEIATELALSADIRTTDSVGVMFTVEMAVILHDMGHKNVTVITDQFCKVTDVIVNKLGYDYKLLEDIKESGLQFDVTLSNNPYNVRKGNVETGRMGTHGDNTLGKKLNRIQRDITKPGGVIAQMGLKGSSLKDALDDPNWNPELLSLMVDKDWWNHNSFWLTGVKEPNNFKYKIYGKDIRSRICAKIFCAGGEFEHIEQPRSYKQLVNDGWITDTDNGNPLCIVRSRKRSDMRVIRAYVTDKGLKKVVTGPKYMCYKAESAVSRLATKEPVLSDCAMIYPTKTITEAKKMKLFTDNNPLLKFMWKTMSIKGQDMFWRNCKKFDLNQIKTGFEYPAEYNLTKAEQKYLNENWSKS